MPTPFCLVLFLHHQILHLSFPIPLYGSLSPNVRLAERPVKYRISENCNSHKIFLRRHFELEWRIVQGILFENIAWRSVVGSCLIVFLMWLKISKFNATKILVCYKVNGLLVCALYVFVKVNLWYSVLHDRDLYFDNCTKIQSKCLDIIILIKSEILYHSFSSFVTTIYHNAKHFYSSKSIEDNHFIFLTFHKTELQASFVRISRSWALLWLFFTKYIENYISEK